MLRNRGIIGSLILLATLACAQQTPTTEPNLPVINVNACPQPRAVGEKEVSVRVALVENQEIYSSWSNNRSVYGTLKAGETVTALAGLEVIREPDQALLTETGAAELTKEYGLSFKRGDRVLRYGLRDDCQFDFWGKGVWFGFFDTEHQGDLNGGCGFADKSECEFAILKFGEREWWIKVKTRNNLVGWMRASAWWSGASISPNFGDICTCD